MKMVCAAAVFVAIAQAQPERQAVSSNATAILVDAVVRDRNGRLVTDLAASDFDLSEDGVAQTIDSFTRVTRQESSRRRTLALKTPWPLLARTICSRNVGPVSVASTAAAASKSVGSGNVWRTAIVEYASQYACPIKPINASASGCGTSAR